MQILPNFMTADFQTVGTIDTYTSLIWTDRYYTCGDFELAVPVGEKILNLLHQSIYITRDDDDNVGIIEDIKITHNEDNVDTVIISGRFLSSILGRRIVATQTTLNGTLSDMIKKLLTENVISPTIAARKIANVVWDNNNKLSTKIQAQYTGDNLLELISNLANTYGFGFKMTLNKSNQFVFKLYEGIDRTYDQSDNPYAIFSNTYDNLVSSNYEENYKNKVSSVLVAGEGEGLDRRTLWVDSADTGLDRYEMYKDQRQLQSDDGTITDEEYNKLLKEAGEESITKYTTAFTGTAHFTKDTEIVQLGDLVVIENSKWNIKTNSRLVEIVESVNEAGEHNKIPTFGV